MVYNIECWTLQGTMIPVTFSTLPAAKPTTSALPFHAIHLRESIDNNAVVILWQTDMSVNGLTCNETNGVVNDINASATCYFKDLLLPVFYGVINAVICTAILFTYVEFSLRASRCDYLRA